MKHEPRVVRRAFERGFAVIGCLLLAVSVGGYLVAQASNRQAIARLEAMNAPWDKVLDQDQSDWSESRIQSHRESLKRVPAGATLGVLRIPGVQLEVAVFAGTDDWTLNRGVGWIPGTSSLEERGNVAIAGHRDGFFRALKDVRPGDLIEVATTAGIHSYVIQKTWVVSPADVDVLESTDASTITLVTCYPFYYIGPAPKRFIVRGVEVGSGVHEDLTDFEPNGRGI